MPLMYFLVILFNFKLPDSEITDIYASSLMCYTNKEYTGSCIVTIANKGGQHN